MNEVSGEFFLLRLDSMNACKNCGQEIRWRTIYGQKTPMGCECWDEERDRSSPASRESFTAEVHCPKCRQLVYFIRHNGGSVWLDELGQPWPKHPCYDNQGSTAGLDDFFKTRETKVLCKIEQVDRRTDLGQRILYLSAKERIWEVYPAPDFWLTVPAPGIGEMMVVNSDTLTLLFRNSFLFRYWPISVKRCPKCSALALNMTSHREICGGGGDAD